MIMSQADKRLNNHIVGKTEYIDDFIPYDNTINGYVLHSSFANANILSIDLEEAKLVDGVYSIITYKDIPGKNDMGAVYHDEPILAEGKCQYIGQAIALIAAKDRKCAQKAKELIKVEYEELKPVLDVEESYEKKYFPFPPYHLQSGNIEEAFQKSDHIVEGTINIGGQEHFYLETQGAVSYIDCEGVVKVNASSQNPTEVQTLLSESLLIDCAKIEVKTGNLGGGFGGKETQGSWCSIWASLLSYHTGKRVKMILSREEDMLMTGKRHPVKVKYKIGFSNRGKLIGYQGLFLFNIGYSSDLSQSIMERCLLHCENSYYIPSVDLQLFPCKTNIASNCAFRGFGAPQGIFVIENIMDIIANTLHKDTLQIRKINLYGIRRQNITPYGERISDNSLPTLFKKILISADYKNRKREIKIFNKQNKYLKRGIAATPVKFGISFTTTHLNQGSAIVNLYKDGSLVIHQGGVEMGQGLYDKIATIASREFSIPLDKIRVYNTNTSIIPNTSATAASTGSDINGHAALIAIKKLKKRIDKFASTLPKETPFEEVLKRAYIAQINLGEKAFYRTLGLSFDKKICKGNPFFYYVYGVCISEIQLDLLTGEHIILRSDIIHDTGLSIDEKIDKGQIEGAFMQGVGWTTMEELCWDDKGYPLTSNPDLYKIPGIYDIPRIMNITLYQENPFQQGVLTSRAIGEPPLIYGLSVYQAIRSAILSATGKNITDINHPLTKEEILKSIYKCNSL